MILGDINIFEDVIRKRDGWVASLEVLNRVRNKKVNGFVSALTVPVLYFLRKLPDREAREKVKEITLGFNMQ